MTIDKRFAKDRYRPDGSWVQATTMQNVVGVQFYKSEAQVFADAARKAEKKGLQYGLQLEHQPNNPHDSNAIAVYGIAEIKGFFSKSQAEWHIGYIDSELSAELVTEFISENIKIAAELHSIYESDNGFLDFNFFVLAPPGNSVSARRNKN